MASTYRIGFVGNAANASAYAAFRAPTRTSKILEIGLATTTAVASPVSLFRNTAGAYTATTSTSVGQADLPIAAAGTSLVDTAWSTAPTVTAASRLMRFQLPATIGAGLIWTFPDGLYVRNATATDYIVLWNETAVAASPCHGYIVWAE